MFTYDCELIVEMHGRCIKSEACERKEWCTLRPAKQASFEHRDARAFFPNVEDDTWSYNRPLCSSRSSAVMLQGHNLGERLRFHLLESIHDITALRSLVHYVRWVGGNFQIRSWSAILFDSRMTCERPVQRRCDGASASMQANDHYAWCNAKGTCRCDKTGFGAVEKHVVESRNSVSAQAKQDMRLR